MAKQHQLDPRSALYESKSLCGRPMPANSTWEGESCESCARIARVKGWRRAPVVEKPSIERIPGVCGGRACVAGTRIPVWTIHALWRAGANDYQVLVAYPSLSVDQLRAALAYGEQHPDETKE